MTSEQSITAIIVDDEPLARVHLRRMLELQNVVLCGEAENAAQALEIAEDRRPDVIFLDIQMPGLTGMQIANALVHLECAPLVVFVTGYSEHAVAAFEHDALDYLLKPVSPDRLALALNRVRERLNDRALREDLGARVAARAQESEPMRRLPIREDYVVRLIPVEEILCAVSRAKRIWVQTSVGEHKTYYTLTQLEVMLPRERFLRIHESCLVNIDEIKEVVFLGNHAYAVRLSNSQQLPVSRARYAELQRRLGLGAESQPWSRGAE